MKNVLPIQRNDPLSKNVGPFTIDHQEILRLIPHRYPFLLIDRVEKLEINHKAVGIKNVSYNEPFFQGHFPHHPIMPGVLIIEAMAQTAAVLVMKSLLVNSDKDSADYANHNCVVYFMSIEEAKFRKPVFPGDQLELLVEKIKDRGNVWKFKAQANTKDSLVSQATFCATIVDSVGS